MNSGGSLHMAQTYEFGWAMLTQAITLPPNPGTSRNLPAYPKPTNSDAFKTARGMLIAVRDGAGQLMQRDALETGTFMLCDSRTRPLLLWSAESLTVTLIPGYYYFSLTGITPSDTFGGAQAPNTAIGEALTFSVSSLLTDGGVIMDNVEKVWARKSDLGFVGGIAAGRNPNLTYQEAEFTVPWALNRAIGSVVLDAEGRAWQVNNSQTSEDGRRITYSCTRAIRKL